ncbi:zinc ribbon domain-containing protein [Actinomadura rugatobispora]|uniref:Zinc ribbon domain-containing protein n=1 Tax=Actinomadura rugatobispora TaxID=1994 RepID=A0ABW0ZUX4_9ACTN|nr:hypothetical protein GCM10010200_056320 [Actinomadura rugatobispora]
MSRKQSRMQLLADGETGRTACAQTVLREGVDEKTGHVLTVAELAARTGWCADLAGRMAAAVLTQRWTAADVAALTSGVDAAGKALPSHAWMALRRLGWDVPDGALPEGVRVNDRIRRMAQEQAGRLLRSVRWRTALTAGILTTWPAAPNKRTVAEWDAVRAAVPDGRGLPGSVIKARTRQIARFERAHGRLPVDVFELEGVPNSARVLLLAACDAQQATLARHESDPGRAVLRVQLPTRPDPRSYADWTWVSCPIVLPSTVPARAVLHLPTLRPTVCPSGAKVRADLAFTHAVPAARRTGHTIALGVDWGLNTLLSAGACRLHPDGRITAMGHGGQFRAGGVLGKGHRLRRQSERLHAKISHYECLAPHLAHQHEQISGQVGGRAASADDQELVAAVRHSLLVAELKHTSARRTGLNAALAWAAARWAADQAIAARASVIYLEDLRSMEAKGQGRTHNTRMSQTVRGQITDRLRHIAAEHGIAVVTVPPRNTSKHCPACLVPLRHCKAPDRPTEPGWKWAICPAPSCGWQGDRDQGAWRRIAARGLTHQATTVVDRAGGRMAIGSVVDTLEAHAIIAAPTTCRGDRADRSKTDPTRPRKTHHHSRPVPRRRGVPSPDRPPGTQPGPAGRRPEGHAPQDPTTAPALPRAARRNQDVTTISITPTTTRPHRPRGAALGAGFHLHAHATPPRWTHPRHTPRMARDP